MRLYPTKEQESRLLGILEVNRIVYNYFVSNNFKDRNDMNYALTELKDQQPILRNYHSKMLQMVSTKIAGAWEGMKVKKARGYRVGDKLDFVKSDECNSFIYNQTGFRIERLPECDKHLLHLSKIGSIELRVHRRMPDDIRQVIVVRQTGKWFAVFTCNVLKRLQSTISYKKSVGIDVGITNYAYDSDGNHVDNPLFMVKHQKKVRRSNKKLSRRVYGSSNYKKALRFHQRLHQRIASKRRDFLHKLSCEYSRRYDVIFLEKLRLNNMVKNHCLARHMMDSSWGTFKQLLDYKANRVVQVDPYHTTVDCSKCGDQVSKTLAIRIHECPRCGVVLDRDHNAALNILQRGLKLLLPMQHGKVKPADTLSQVVEAGTSPRSLDVGS
jgi:putative transposase